MYVSTSGKAAVDRVPIIESPRCTRPLNRLLGGFDLMLRSHFSSNSTPRPCGGDTQILLNTMFSCSTHSKRPFQDLPRKFAALWPAAGRK